MSIVDGKGLVVWEGCLFEPGSDLLRRVQWAFAAIREAGGTIIANEGGRPYGVYRDRFAREPEDTESGLSTVHFQWGRYLRDETPSAANPAGGIYASEHTRGIAIDCNAFEPALRRKYFALVGLENTIASESWHWAIRGRALVDLSGFSGLGSTPFDNQEEDDMYDGNDRNSTAQIAEKVTDVIPPAIEVVRAAVGNVQTDLKKLLKESAMPAFLLSINDGEHRYGGGTLYALTGVGVDYFVEVTTVDAANAFAAKFGDAINVTYAEWDAFKAAAGVRSTPAHA